MKFRQIALKRLIDIAMALVGLVIAGIVAIIVAPIVKKQSPGPLIFKQNVLVKTVKFLKFTNLEACTPMPKNAKRITSAK